MPACAPALASAARRRRRAGVLLARSLVLALALPLGACSRQAWYQGARAQAEYQCRQLPSGAYDDCMARVHREPYDRYEKERRGD